MNRQQNTLRIACGLAIALFSAPALAQVAPPPTKPAEQQPTYTPAPKPEPKPAAQPAQPQPKEGMTARRRDPGNIEDLPTNVPYPKLAQKGPDGRILRLRQLPDILALRSNPTIGPVTVEKIMPLVYLRRYKMETSVIDNLDLYWELTNGMIENLDMSDINEMGRAADMIKPLVPEVTLSQDLLNRQILTRTQGGMNNYIVREYKKAITDEIQVLDGNKGLEEVMRFVLQDSLHEATLAYEGLLVESMGRISELMEKTGVDSSEAKALAAIDQEPTDNPEEQFMMLRTFDEAFRKLSYDDAMSIFTTMRSEREFENISPTITKIDVMHDRKKVMGGDMSIQMTDGVTGDKKFDSKEQKKDN
jgi:hypothetical protein